MKLSSLLCAGALAAAGALVVPTVHSNPSTRPSVERDGSHDFDFDVGVWKTHIVRRLHPLSGSTEWIELRREF